jgi:hypothetical protein
MINMRLLYEILTMREKPCIYKWNYEILWNFTIVTFDQCQTIEEENMYM